METSPLSEASPESLQELFDKDPLKLTDPDIERVVTELRAQRGRWEISQKTRKAPKAETISTAASLEDLGL